MNLIRQCGFVKVVEGLAKKSTWGFKSRCAVSMFWNTQCFELRRLQKWWVAFKNLSKMTIRFWKKTNIFCLYNNRLIGFPHCCIEKDPLWPQRWKRSCISQKHVSFFKKVKCSSSLGVIWGLFLLDSDLKTEIRKQILKKKKE